MFVLDGLEALAKVLGEAYKDGLGVRVNAFGGPLDDGNAVVDALEVIVGAGFGRVVS